ncbi:MAG: DUF5050 domain-containing protein [Lachnospiraceae bacterium]|nr:DUF5050 domain-containing protein [Lachnospiraceae bacterium]
MKKFATGLGIALAILGVLVIAYLNGRTHYNPEGVRGNTTGNLNNNGMFAEYDGKIYFANPYDENRLYVMNSDCSKIKKLNDDTVCSINAYGNYLYYVRNNYTTTSLNSIFRGQLLGVIRCRLNGKSPKSLYESVAGVVNLYGNTLYYQHYSNTDGLSFYKVDIDGTNEKRISDNASYPASIYGGSIYYVNTEGNHSIYTYNMNTGANNYYWEANAYMVDMEGDYLYYIDLDADYSLVRVSTTTGIREVLVDGSAGHCIAYNYYNGVIFYHVEGDSPALYRMNADGSDVEFIRAGNITNISCTSQYTFFQIFNTNYLYRVPTKGSTQAELVSIQ